jgi:hypothetical protein
MTSSLKILLVSNGFYPEISPRSFRATELAKEFVRQGHQVRAYTKFRDFDYTEFLNNYPMDLRIWPKYRFQCIPQWKGKLGLLISRGLKRLALMLAEYPGIEDMLKVSSFLRNEGGHDLMISFAVPYPVHWGVALARTKKHPIAGTWVADCGDPYMGCDTDSFKKLFYFRWVEKWFMRKADFITIPIESARKAYYPEFHDKIKVIPQGFEFKLVRSHGKKIANPVPAFAYAGGFIPGIRDPRPFIQYLETISDPFRFIVYTRDQSLIQSFLKNMNGKLEIRDYIPRDQLLEELAKMDFLVNFDNNTGVQSPSKLIDYALTGRPVLNFTSSPDHGIIKQFIKGNYKGRMEFGSLEQYNIKYVARQFLDVIEHK